MPSDRMTLALFFLWDSTGVKLGLHNRDTVCELCLGGGINYNYTIKWLKGLHYSHFRGLGRNFFDWAVDWTYMHKTFYLFISCTLHILVFCLSDNTCTVCSWTSIQRCFNFWTSGKLPCPLWHAVLICWFMINVAWLLCWSLVRRCRNMTASSGT